MKRKFTQHGPKKGSCKGLNQEREYVLIILGYLCRYADQYSLCWAWYPTSPPAFSSPFISPIMNRDDSVIPAYRNESFYGYYWIEPLYNTDQIIHLWPCFPYHIFHPFCQSNKSAARRSWWPSSLICPFPQLSRFLFQKNLPYQLVSVFLIIGRDLVHLECQT